ncbi:MAG TPA: biotin--[acetyl-CoA-carboxylase] ligase, partial [Paludibacter sp.]
KSQVANSLLNDIRKNIMDLYFNLDANKIRDEYAEILYRKAGVHKFKEGDEIFQASIIAVHPDGQLELEKENGERKGYYFKEVSFIV